MEVSPINEQLMDAQQSAASSLQSTIDDLQTVFYAPVKEIVERYQESHFSEKELLQVKEYYSRKKYVDRIKRQLQAKS